MRVALFDPTICGSSAFGGFDESARLQGKADGRLPAELQQLEHLKMLDLQSTKVIGDLEIFKKCPRLEQLFLGYTNVRGDLVFFCVCDSLPLSHFHHCF